MLSQRVEASKLATQQERLLKAQNALRQAETKSSVRAVRGEDLRDGFVGGTYHLGASSLGLANALQAPADPGVYLPQMLAMLRALDEPDAWVALVGVADVGWDAVAQMGLDVTRMVAVRLPAGGHQSAASPSGPQAAALGTQSLGDQSLGAKVLGSLVEGFQVVVVGEVSVGVAQQRVLAARARALRTTLLTVSFWPGVSSSPPISRARFSEPGRGVWHAS